MGRIDRSIIDEIVTVSNYNAFETARKLAKMEGILCKISSGASVCAALQYAKKNNGKRIVAILPGISERYITTDLFI
ncbi:MAG: pyridoxal-phosphate dependent enzyme [Pseudomonadota bacterium]